MKTDEELYNRCYSCKNNRMDIKSGVLCEFTGMKPQSPDDCLKYDQSESFRYASPKENSYFEKFTKSESKFDISNDNPIEKRNIKRYKLGISLDIAVLIFLTPLSVLGMLSFANDFSVKVFILTVLLSGISVILIIDVRKKIIYIFNREKDPLRRYLSNYGDYDKICNQIMNEVKEDSIKIYSIHISKNWMVNKRLTKTWIINLSDIVWCYYYCVKSNISNSHYVIICDNQSREHQINCQTEKNVINIINILKSYRPEIIVGFSDDVEQVWKKNPLIIINEVKKRKK